MLGQPPRTISNVQEYIIRNVRIKYLSKVNLQFLLSVHYDGAEPGDPRVESLLSPFLAGVAVCECLHCLSTIALNSGVKASTCRQVRVDD